MDHNDVIEAADKMDKAFSKLLKDLATDGTAIDGFTDAWNALAAYNEARYNYEFSKLVHAPTNSEGDE